MLSESQIPAELILAYRQTHYKVQPPHGPILRIDEPSPELLRRQAAQGAACSAFITACNPYSRGLAPADNQQRHAALAQHLQGQGLTFFEALGQHPSNGWPGEPSYLVLGLDLPEARQLGEQLQQNAIVWSGPDAVPRLILLR